MASLAFPFEGAGALVTRAGNDNWLVCRFYTRSFSIRPEKMYDFDLSTNRYHELPEPADV